MTDPLHIAYYAPSWPPGTGKPNGIVTALSHTIPAMLDRGHRVTVFTPLAGPPQGGEVVIDASARPGILSRLTTRVRRVSGKSKDWQEKGWEGLRASIKDVEAEDPIDVFETEESFGLPARIQTVARAAIVCRLHGPWREALGCLNVAPGASDAERIENEVEAAAASDGLTAPARSLLALYAQPQTPSRAVPNPVPKVRGGWQGAGAGKRIAFVGRIDRRKGADVAMLAAAELMRSDESVTMVLCGADGGTEPSDGPLSFSEFLSDNIEAELHRRFDHRGVLAPKAVAEMRREASVVVVASRYENFPYSVAEAMVEGCPVVAATVGGIPELITDDETGLLVPPGEVSALAGAIGCLLQDPQAAARLGTAARRWAETHLDPAAIAEETEAFYREVIASRG